MLSTITDTEHQNWFIIDVFLLNIMFRHAVVSLLVDKAILAAKETNAPCLAMAGGVSANRLLRRMMQEACDKNGIPLYMPKLSLCTDNGAMIGSAAYYRLMRGESASLTLNAQPALRLV